MCDTKEALEIKSSNTSSVNQATDSNGAMQNLQSEAIINLDTGDPTMYESYWKTLGQKQNLTIPGFQSLSYISNPKTLCWFLEPKLEQEIKMLHNIVGNAIFKDHHIIVGTGSSQLIMAAFYALSEPLNHPNPINVVAAAPYYSAYPAISNLLRSGFFKWGGDANTYDHKEETYIELVTSPNNPDGILRKPVVENGPKGMLIHDLAYYWPQYTAITSPADHDLMLFTVSKCTGHAGSRIGWALVRDENVAKKMVKFIDVSTIGVSKEAQLRAASILEAISVSCQRVKIKSCDLDNFFEHSHHLLSERWNKLRKAINKNELFSVAKFLLQYCNFTGDFTETYPAFAWMKCKDGVDCEKLLREHKILARSGRQFGSDPEYVRVSMMGRDEEFHVFLKRLQTIVGSK